MIKTTRKVTLIDGEVVEFPSEEHDQKGHDQIWELKITANTLAEDGTPCHLTSPTVIGIPVHVPRSLLVKHGLLPKAHDDQQGSVETETVETLMLKILDHLGVQR